MGEKEEGREEGERKRKKEKKEGREGRRKVSKSELEKNHLAKYLGAKMISFRTAMGNSAVHSPAGVYK